ncbi:MAG: hypothetical protein ABIG20_04785 [archaeon]
MWSNRKGAAMVVEQAFIAVFGIVILITVMIVFSNLRIDFSKHVAEAQFDEVGAVTHNAVLQAYENGKYANSAKVVVRLPGKLGGMPYTVSLTNDNITVQNIYGDVNRTLGVMNITANLSGNCSSTGSGPCVVEYNSSSGNITLETL